MTIVIAGGGMSAGNAAAELRDEGYDGRLVVVGDEAGVPFGRPPLSKTYLRGEDDLSDWLVRPPEWYTQEGVELRIDDPVVGIEGNTVVTRRGTLGFDRLLVATGVRNRRLGVSGEDLDGVLSLRTRADGDRIRSAIAPGDRVVIVGAGFIGCEVAASLATLGVHVVALFPGAAPLGRVLGDAVGNVLAGVHAEHGVDLLPGERVAFFEGSTRVEAVRTQSGRRLPCTAVLVAVGVRPNVELLDGSGIAVDDGVLVDDRCRTNVAGVYACGDVANMAHPLFGRVRVEHYNNAEKHGRAAARSLIGKGETYKYLFTFWSDQYDQKLEYVGLAHEWDEFVVRGSLQERSLVGFYLKDGVLRAAVGLGRGGDPELEPESELAACAALIAGRARPAPSALTNENVDLRSLSD
jgi:3-phenylpropionate/trans-cinnamate dioxygenase ferredoxin reductase subunit